MFCGRICTLRVILLLTCRFLFPSLQRFHLASVQNIIRTSDDFPSLAAAFAQYTVSIMSEVPTDLHSSFTVALQLHQLEAIFKAMSAPQLLALHRGIPEGASKRQAFQILQYLQKVLVSQPLANLRSVHQMYQNEGPDADNNALAKMLQIGPENFFVVDAVRQVMSLDANQLKALRESLSLFSAAHLNLLVELMVLDNFKVLDMRVLFVPLLIEEPENFLGGGFGLGLSGGNVQNEAMDEDEDEDDDEYGEEWQSPIRLEISEQPPKACVYRRNVRPSPEIVIKGVDGRNPRLRVAVVVIRTDTMAALDVNTSLSGEVEYKASAGMRIVFKKLKVMQTSNQLGDTHVALRFELRDYSVGSNDDYQVLHSVQSIPFMVMSHSTQLKKPKELAPTVCDVIPPEGFIGGGTRVVILGDNFMDTPGLRVRFERIDVQPSYHGPRTLVCIVPPGATPGNASVRVCNDAKKWGDPGDVSFLYVQHPDPVHVDSAMPMDLQEKQRQQSKIEFFDLNNAEAVGQRPWATESGTDLSFMLSSSMQYPQSLNASFNFNTDLSSSK